MPRDASPRANLGRTISFQFLGEAALYTHSSMDLDSGHKRRSAQSEDEGETENESTHKSKRARNFKPRIACYPRIRVSVPIFIIELPPQNILSPNCLFVAQFRKEKLEALRTKSSQEQTLALLRLLKFVESVMFQDKDLFADNATMQDPMQPSPADVEMIILDLR
jgi:hypothetical protein